MSVKVGVMEFGPKQTRQWNDRVHKTNAAGCLSSAQKTVAVYILSMIYGEINRHTGF